MTTTSPLPPPTPTTTTKPQPSASLYVGELPGSVSEANLFEIFSNVGHIASIRVCRDHLTKRSLGYAYINFLQAKDAERALDTLNNTIIKGKPCRIMWCQRDPSVRKSGVGNIFIKNLDLSIGHKELYDTFSAFGNILSCKVAFDENGHSKGFGFVHYENQVGANRAIELVNDRLILNRRVYVAKFESKKERNLHKESSWTNVYIKDIGVDVTEEDLLNTFGRFGPITSISIKRSEDGTSKGFGFVNFREHEHAVKALNGLNNTLLGKEQKPIWCGRAQKKSERESELKNKFKQLQMDQYNKYNGINLYIKNLEEAVQEEELRKEFSAFGTIRSLKIMTDEKNNSKGFGFICYLTPEEAHRAISEMNNRPLNGYMKPLFITFHEPKEIRRQKLAQDPYQRKQNIRPLNMLQPVYPPVYSYPPTNPGPQYMYPPQIIRQSPARGWTYPTSTQPLSSYPTAAQPSLPRSHARNPISSAQHAKAIPESVAVSSSRRPPMEFGLTLEQLSLHPPELQRIIIGEKLYVQIYKIEPKRVPKITGMLLESGLSIVELLTLLESEEKLHQKIQEAVSVLENSV
jgi:polyadenylate-binding protein